VTRYLGRVTGKLTVDDLAGLRQLVDRYADVVDRRDESALAGLFTADGSIRVQPDDGPVQSEWSGENIGMLLEPLRSYFRTFHHIGGAVFDARAHGAEGRVHCLAHHYQRTESGPVDLVMLIRYDDRYERAEGGWLIADRRVAVQWTELNPAHPVRQASR
jgi:hypothetical protein